MPVKQQTRDRLRSAAGAGLFHAILAYALVTGLGVDFKPEQQPSLAVFDIAADPPRPMPEPPPPPQRRQDREEGAASPENLKSRATPVVAPKPLIRLEPPPTIVSAAVPATGAEATTGASDKPGPGTGAGGEGDGTGSGGRGNGDGSGGPATRARLTRGGIKDSDYPRSAARAGAGGTVIARLSIGADGRVEACTIASSSGHADLDAATCRLIQRRFRYAPARNREGHAVPDTAGWRQRWWLEGRD